MNVYDFKVKDNEGKEVSLDKYKGKVLLIVNTATKCGLTPQYEGLEKLYDKLKDRGFETLDFPCNQFLNQAPESDEKINEFCTLTYGTTFPRFAKIDVNGKDADPLFVWLKEQKPEDKTDGTSKSAEFMNKVMKYVTKEGDIKWNFGKFLIDREGNVVERFSPSFKPENLEGEIEKYL